MSANLQLNLFLAPPEPDARGAAEALILPELPRALPAGGLEREALVRGHRVPCRLRRSERARDVRLLVDRAARLTIVVPRRVPLREVPAALAEHATWIVRTVERQRRRGAVTAPTVVDGGTLEVLGATHVLRIPPDEALDRRPRVRLEDGVLHVQRPPLHPRTAAELVRGWLRAVAAREIPPRVVARAAQLGLAPARVSVRNHRSKWGACSARGHVSLNWRLVLAPPDVLDYVVVHELCHLRELNHSVRFWSLVRRWFPGCEEARAWLRERGDSLDL